MAFEQEIDPRSTRVAQFLRQNNVSLWEPPYWENERANIPNELIVSTADECRLPNDTTLSLLLELQNHALQRVRERQLLVEKGLMTIKVRMQRKEYKIKIAESSTVSDLYEEIAAETKIHKNQIRLIHNGQKLNNENVSLTEKKIKNNAKIVGLVTSAKIEEHIREELRIVALDRKTSRAKSNARTLSALDQCEITNQFGNKVDLPENIKLDLTAALSLHNKGRFEMKRNKAERALNYLLEAERIIQSIDPATCPILDQLSNVALLNLDVVWCFLEVGSLNHLADGDRRLLAAERGLIKAYGPNMERVTKAKGNATNEQTLYVRLKLLQGVAAFYKANYEEARRKFSQAEALMAKLRVNEEHLVTLLSFGYSAKECRLALRQTNNILDLALNYLEEKKMLREKEYTRWRIEQKNKYLKGVNKTWFDRMISDVGVSPVLARRALLHCDNDYNRAVKCALDWECSMNKAKQDKEAESQKRRSDNANQNSDNEAGPSSGSGSKSSKTTSNKCSESDLDVLVSMGVDRTSAVQLLEFFKGSLYDAENFLLNEREEFSQVDAMLSKMRKFISEETEDYLDSTLEKELECLNVFSARLAQIDSVTPNSK